MSASLVHAAELRRFKAGEREFAFPVHHSSSMLNFASARISSGVSEDRIASDWRRGHAMPLRWIPALAILTIALLSFPTAVSAAEGLPVENELVRNACGACHQIDAGNRMSRISYVRKTPEGWQESVKRMLRLGYVQLTPEEARTIVRYLADHHCLTPSEVKPVFYDPEKRRKHEELPDNEDFRSTCTACHLGARALAQRRTAEEWQLLKGMHLGYFPRAPFQDERRSEQNADDTEDDRADRAFDYLAQNYMFDNPDWRSFQAKRTVPDLSGRWLVATYERGKGLVAGDLLMEKSGDDYQTRSTLVLPDGAVERREGTGILYAGYSWRGSSKGDSLGELKEVLMLSGDRATLSGRFYRGVYGELGLDDVTLVRLGADSRIAGLLPRSLPAPRSSATVRIVGANFPGNLGPEDIDLGPGVQIKSVSVVGPGILEVLVEVADDALPGSRNVSVGAAAIVDAFAIYDRIDYVKVRPEDGMARVGGVRIAKRFVQFEAVAFHRGADGKPFTKDDIDLGPVRADWSLKEYHVRFGDDDVRYVGTIDETGLFTPNVEGPNPDRGQENNIGDVWVVATHTPEGSTRPLKGRAHLLVTVPIYTLWDFFPEYTQ